MNVSTFPLTPDLHHGPGVGACAEPPTTRQPADANAYDLAFTRATHPDYHRWLAHVTPAAGCTHPIRLHGEIATVEQDTGRLLDLRSTSDMPDGVIYTNCGNRRAAVCPSCAETYRRDAYELIRTGLVGGKEVPASVATHPAVFLTLTAPSFGPVHTRRTSRDGRVLPCRPRRTPDPCPHGIEQRCHHTHADGQRALGTPLCPDCYDYPAQVVWNRSAGELWRRTRIALDRATKRLLGSGVRLRYAKVAEFQTRGVVHFHLVVRLDGHDPELPGIIFPPPSAITTDDLTDIITSTVPTVAFTTAGHPIRPAGWSITWGQQLDVRPIRLTGDGDLTDNAAAGYLAKYATKSTEATGHISSRLDPDTIDLYANPAGTHPERLIAACWNLGADPTWRGLRRWAHMLGFGGHFLTKARDYSVSFQHLRQRRIAWRRRRTLTDDHDQAATLVLAWLSYVGAGWRTTGDALLANTAAARAREQRQAAREELAQLANQPS